MPNSSTCPRCSAALAPSSSDVLSTEQAATVADVTPKTIRTWVETRGLRATRRGRLLAILRVARLRVESITTVERG